MLTWHVSLLGVAQFVGYEARAISARPAVELAATDPGLQPTALLRTWHSGNGPVLDRCFEYLLARWADESRTGFRLVAMVTLDSVVVSNNKCACLCCVLLANLFNLIKFEFLRSRKFTGCR